MPHDPARRDWADQCVEAVWESDVPCAAAAAPAGGKRGRGGGDGGGTPGAAAKGGGAAAGERSHLRGRVPAPHCCTIVPPKAASHHTTFTLGLPGHGLATWAAGGPALGA